MHWPSERICTTASLSCHRYFGVLPERGESAVSRTRGRTDPRLLRLEAGHVLRLQALGTFANFKFNGLSFVERFVAVHHDCREMDENVFARLTLYESVTL